MRVLLFRVTLTTVILAAAHSLGACQTPGGSEVKDTGGTQLGTLDDDSAKAVIYKALEARMNRTESLGDDGDQTTELAADDVFEFTVVKMAHDGVEVISGKGEQATELDVEVHGWYRRTRSKAEDGVGPECVGFDVSAKIERKATGWQLMPEQDLVPVRETPEDCY